MDKKQVIAYFEYAEHEKGIKRDISSAALEEALRSAARKSIKGLLNIEVKINSKTGEIIVTAQKEVVEKVTIPNEEILLEEARLSHPDAEIGEWIDVAVMPPDFGRIAAKAAGDVMRQKMRSAERDVIYEEYRHRVQELISGTVKRVVRGATLIVDLGKVEGILPDRYYPKTEKYAVGDRVQALLYDVPDTSDGGAEVILNRSCPEFVRQLFIQEVPEINDGTIVIERIVRDPGYRTKLAVYSQDPKIDPVGACVGVRGTRVKNIIRELNNEKIDIIPFVEDPIQLLYNALAPHTPKKIHVGEDEEGKSIISIVVDDEVYPAALGKRGMNARLNGELIRADLQIQKMSDYQTSLEMQRQELATSEDPSLDEKLHVEKMSKLIIDSLIAAGYDTPRKVLCATVEELSKIPEISPDMAFNILEEVRKSKIT